MLKTLIKRNGQEEAYDPMKLIRWSQWAAKHLGNRVDWAKIVRKASEQLDVVSTTQRLQDILIELCNQEGSYAYSRMGGRLFAAKRHKELYNDKIPSIQALHEKLVDIGLMEELGYTENEYAFLENHIVHHRDFEVTQFQLDQIRNKYSLKNLITGEEYESAQFVFMRMAMAVFSKEENDKLNHVVNFYHHLSLSQINAPSPNYINLGTPHRGLASCCLYVTDDTAASIAAGNHIAETMTYMSAGIGGAMLVRSITDPVRGGRIVHQGKLPYYKATAGVVKSNMQAGRGGALTSYYSGFDPEAPVIAFLQNPRAPDKKKNRDMHFAMMGNSFMAKLAAEDAEMMQFNCYTAPELWKALFSPDIKKFEQLYREREADTSIKKTYVNATRFIRDAMQQSYEVGTHYMAFMDEINRHTPFKEPIHCSNLCLEIAEPTATFKNARELYDMHDNGFVIVEDFDGKIVKHGWSDRIELKNDDVSTRIGYAGEMRPGVDCNRIIDKRQTPEVALCSLGGLVLDNIKDDETHRSAAYYTLRMIDYCIDNAHYELPNIGWTAKLRRNAGVGTVGLATVLARKNLRYDTEEGLAEIHRISEDHMYFLIEASVRIAEERGPAPWIHKTKWPEGWLPIDTYRKSVDTITPNVLRRPWEPLRARIIKAGGIGHSCLAAEMPTESSSKAAGQPNGRYPVRSLALKKSDQSNVIDWVAPDNDLIGDQYQPAWSIKPLDMIKMYAVSQKFLDHSISADTYRDRSKDIFLSSHDLVQEYIDMARYGMKTRYYANVLTSSGGEVVDSSNKSNCGSGGCTL